MSTYCTVIEGKGHMFICVYQSEPFPVHIPTAQARPMLVVGGLKPNMVRIYM